MLDVRTVSEGCLKFMIPMVIAGKRKDCSTQRACRGQTTFKREEIN